jgi:EAL domain-containing protein (putative c-di-GMP-specific phosphodiesterase class I)
MVTVVFQPIVLLGLGTVAAYEALGSGRHPDLPESPTELFQIAERRGAEAELGRLFRTKTAELAAKRPDLPTIFLKMHPTELAQPGFRESLDELRRLAPRLDLALEIPDWALTRPAAMGELRALLLERNIALAYGSFEAGRARLLELAEAAPDYSPSFTNGLDQAPASRRQLLASLLSLTRDLSAKSIAVDIETAAEARACANVGFTHGQGLHFGRPRAIEQI